MHPDDRRYTLAVSTEDVPREQQIINTEEKVISASDSYSVSISSCKCSSIQEPEKFKNESIQIDETSDGIDNTDGLKMDSDIENVDNYEESEEEEEEVRHSIRL